MKIADNNEQLTLLDRFRKLTTSVTFWLILVQLFTAGVAFLVNLLSSTSLIPADRGYLALFLQIGYLITTMALLGVERPYVATTSTVGFSAALSQLHRLVIPGMVASVFLLLIAGIICIFYNFQLGITLLIGAAFVITNICLRLVRSATISSRIWRGYILTAFSSQVILLIIAVVFTLYGIELLIWWIAAYTVAGLVPTVFAGVALRGQTLADYATTFEFKRVRREGIRLLPATLGSMSMQRADRLLLPFLASPAALGIYVVAATAVAISVWPVQQWSDSQLKKWANSAEQRWSRVLLTIVIAATITLVLALFLAGVVWLVIEYLLSPDYEPAKKLLVPLIVAYVLYAVSRVQQGMMIAAGRSKNVTFSEVAGMGTSVIACFVLIPWLGAIGAAYSIALGNIMSCLLSAMLWFRFLSSNKPPVTR